MTESQELSFEATVSAPIGAVLDGLTSDGSLAIWWRAGAGGCGITEASIQPWSGGSFRICASDGSGPEPVEITGLLLGVSKECVRFTLEEPDVRRSCSSVVEIQLQEDGERTKVRIVHEDVPATRVAALSRFWRRVLIVMRKGIPRLEEIKSDGWASPGNNVDMVAAALANIGRRVANAVGNSNSDLSLVREHVGGAPELSRLQQSVADRLSEMLPRANFELFPPSLGFGDDPEVRVSPSVGGSDLPGGAGSVGVQVDINPDGESDGPIGRLNLDVHLDEDGDAVGASVGWRCRF